MRFPDRLTAFDVYMADNTVLSTNVGTGDTIRTEDRTTYKTPVSLIDVGGTASENLVTDGTQGMPTEGVAAENAAVAGNPVLVGGRYDATPRTLGDGDVGAAAMDADGAVHVSDGGNVLSVDDGSGSLTVDNAALSVTGGGVESTALRVTIASDSTGVVSVDDNGSSLTVDNTNIDNLHSSDFDTGAGTDTTTSIGIAVPASGGAAVITGDATNGLDVDVTRVGGNVSVIGTAADGAAASGNPVQVAGKTTGGTLQTIATDDDGELIVHQKAGSTALADDQSNTTAVPLTEDETAVIYTPTVPYMFDGAAWDRVRGDATNGLLVNLGGNNDVSLNAGTNAIGKLAANSGVDIGDVDVLSIAAGDNNIGNVDIVTVPAPLSTTGGGTEAAALRVTVASDSTGVLSVDDNGSSLTVDNGGTFATQATLQAGTALAGRVSVGHDASNRFDGATALTPKFANIDTATSGDNAIVAAVVGKTIRVISVFLAASGAVDVYFHDGTANLLGGTRKVKLDNTGAAGAVGFSLGENNTGWFQTAGTNRAINLNLSGAVGVAGCLTYVEV